jgi:hypothetical protein
MEAKMKPFVAIVVCAAVLYGIDAYWLNGQYFAILEAMLSQINAHR